MRRMIGLVIGILICVAAGAAFLSENALHVWNRNAPADQQAEAIAHQGGAAWRNLRISAADGSILVAWLFTPPRGNGAAVILMHGVSDTRLGMSAHAPFLLETGYTVLMPDSRGHGASGGEIITYGIREADDVHLWANALLREPGIERLYGLGQSMGAAILIESLACEPRFRAIVADSPFATFQEIAFDRLRQHGVPFHAASWPLVELGFAYARLRYGVNLWQASPLDVLRRSRTPVLLIHGLADDNIDPRHSRALRAANPAIAQLWEVPRAAHAASWSSAPATYHQRVREWFSSHR
jgi:dipeptidyl aminopeptidase/acylaminoacyl peptidase